MFFVFDIGKNGIKQKRKVKISFALISKEK